MPQPKFQRYKHIQISRNWRYCRAAIYSNGKVKPHVVVVGGQEEKHEEGSYCIRNKRSWIEAGTDPLPRGNTMESQETLIHAPKGVANGRAASSAAPGDDRCLRERCDNLPDGPRNAK